ncbi:DUF937 domain-containing protein [Hyphomicrobium sp. xq]|uniref:DUF937 domain-containing protein n=1 Tax=Hyphomicrobium album TaxID=2665159 RepID=A0A6I3KR33_9HYPH|nr:YidB family protein [Hyphomicrobium album]MTD96107.1 DUF937 domain-containing protein [Hyphomicrobium album]
MGILDDALKQFTQGGGGNASQPLVVILQELLVGKPQQPGVRQASPQQEAEVPQSSAAPQGGAGAGGLGGLLAQLQAAGLDDAVKSWIGTGQNKPVQPEDLGDALGKRAVTQMADKAGCSQQDLLSQLAAALPGIIDKLTQDGRVPTQAEINQRIRGQ